MGKSLLLLMEGKMLMNFSGTGKININDSPIESQEDDLYNFGNFAESMADSISKLESPEGVVIAISGTWGSGKSSLINIVRRKLEKHEDKLPVTEFKCWWFNGEEPLVFAFLSHLNTALAGKLGIGTKEFSKICRKILFKTESAIKAIPLPDTLAWLPGVMKFLGKLFLGDKSIEGSLEKLRERIKKSNKKLVIIIDDMDRLDNEELMMMLKLIKTVGKLPNIIYIVAFDKNAVEKSINKRGIANGKRYLEKIIQTFYNTPVPYKNLLATEVIKRISKIKNLEFDKNTERYRGLLWDLILPLIITPRHVTNYCSTVNLNWRPVEDEVDFGDFLVMEALKIYDSKLFECLKENRETLCFENDRFEDEVSSENLDDIIKKIRAPDNARCKKTLLALFPKLDVNSTEEEYLQEFSREKRLCIKKYCDTYFNSILSPMALSKNEFENFWSKIADESHTKNILIESSDEILPDSRSKASLYLENAILHANDLNESDTIVLLKVILSIHNKISHVPNDLNMVFHRSEASALCNELIRNVTKDLTFSKEIEILTECTPNSSISGLIILIQRVLWHSKIDPENANEILEKDQYLQYSREILLDKIEVSEVDDFVDHVGLFFLFSILGWTGAFQNRAAQVWVEKNIENPKFAANFIRGLHGHLLTNYSKFSKKMTFFEYLQGSFSFLNFPLLVSKIKKMLEKGEFDRRGKEIVVQFFEDFKPD